MYKFSSFGGSMDNSQITEVPFMRGGRENSIAAEISLRNRLPQAETSGIKMSGKECRKCGSSNTKYLESIYLTQYQFTMGDTAGLLRESSGIEIEAHEPLDPRCIPPRNLYDPLFLIFVIVPLILLYLYLFSADVATPYVNRISSWEYLLYMGFAALSIVAGFGVRAGMKEEYLKKMREYEHTVLCFECGELSL